MATPKDRAPHPSPGARVSPGTLIGGPSALPPPVDPATLPPPVGPPAGPAAVPSATVHSPDVWRAESPTDGEWRSFLDDPGEVPADRRSAWWWLLFAVVGFVIGQIGAGVATAIAAAVTGRSGQLSAIANLAEPPEWYIVSSLIGLWIGFSLGPLMASWLKGSQRNKGIRRFAHDVGLRFRPIDLVGIVIGFGGQILIGLVYLPFRAHLHNFNGPAHKLTGGAHGAGFLLIAVFTVVGAPFFEEIFFRGLLFRALARIATPAGTGGSATGGTLATGGALAADGSPADGSRAAVGSSWRRVAGVALAIVLDGLLFGLAHAELEQLAGLALFGMILAFVSYRTGRLGMNMVSHATFNLIALLAVLNTRGGIIH